MWVGILLVGVYLYGLGNTVQVLVGIYTKSVGREEKEGWYGLPSSSLTQMQGNTLHLGKEKQVV